MYVTIHIHNLKPWNNNSGEGNKLAVISSIIMLLSQSDGMSDKAESIVI